MNSIAKWSVENRVTVNLIMIFIILAGLFSVSRMRRELFPQYALDYININVVYPGASPEEAEEGICVKIEEALKGIEGIKQLRSTASQNMGNVFVEVEPDSDLQKVLDDIKTQVDAIDTFPDDAKKPVITQIVNRNPAISVAVYGDVSERRLREIAEKIKDDLVDLKPISMATLVGVREYEIRVEVSEENLRRYGITFDHVVNAIKSESIDLPGGVIKTDKGEILIRSKGQRYTGREFESIPLISLPDGTVVHLGQVANVIDGFEDTDVEARFNGKPAAMIQVNRTSSEDVIDISEAVRKYIAHINPTLPKGVNLAMWFDISQMVRDRIDLLLRNGLQGMILVFITLAVFLNLRLAFWVAAGIPVAFMGAFMMLDYIDASINMISLFAFIMTLGIIVDDAIIIGENIYTHFAKGRSPKDAVVLGLTEVGGPVVMAVMTTVVAFCPLLYIEGVMGKFIAIMPLAVITILIVSLGEALIILPAHLNHALTMSLTRSNRLIDLHEKLRSRMESYLTYFIENPYSRAINFVVRNRYFTLSIGVGVLIMSIGMVKGGYVPFVFMPKAESNWIIAEVSYPLGTNFNITEHTIRQIEQKAFELNTYFKEKSHRTDDLVANVFSLVGQIPRRDWKSGDSGGHCGQVWIELLGSEQRGDFSINEAINKWRSLVGPVPGIDSLLFYTIEGGPAGNPIEIRIIGNQFDELKQAANELKTEIAKYDGTFDITDDFKPGKKEKQIFVKDGARSLGITMFDIARQVQQAFLGEEALTVQRGKDDVKVRVMYAQKDREHISGIEQMRIRTRDGREVPIQAVADIKDGRSYSIIRRLDRKRAITVISDLDESVANANEIIASLDSDFFPTFKKKHPNLKIAYEGQQKRTKESLDSIKRGYLLAMMGVFLLLASQFKSYNQPVIIMVAIPFGLIGAVFGHWVLGMELTIISIFGIVALSGIVVNDSLILIDFINKAVREGQKTEVAVIQSGKDRFRAVMLTSVTTIAGLFPLLLERSFQAQVLIPMAVSLCFGLLAATMLTLLYVPALYLIVEDIKVKFGLKSIQDSDDLV